MRLRTRKLGVSEIMLSEIKELFKYRDLVKQLVVRDLKVRYKNSVLGFFWSLITPLVLVATITIVVKFFMGIAIPNYSAYLLAAFLPWMFFQMSLMDASQAVLMHHDLLKKVYFPREVLPISIVISNLIHFLLALVVFFIYLIWLRANFMPSMFLLPVLIFFHFLLNVGLALLVSALNVFYEDVKYMVSMLLNILFYLTPIMYLSEMVQHALRNQAYGTIIYRLYELNPLNALIIGYRKILLAPYSIPSGKEGRVTSILTQFEDQPLDWSMLAIAFVVCAAVAVLGYAFFNRRKWGFAEQI